MKDSRGADELSLRTHVSLLAGSGFIRALASTWRYTTSGEAALTERRAKNLPVLFALWHGQMLPLIWHHRNEGVTVLVSEHKDGELIARLLNWMGYALIRGSTSRGAGRALLHIVRTLREGHDVAITPDGPRGPRHKFAPGAAVAANRANVPILPIAAHVDRFWQLKTWDGFIIPKPFAKITVAYGPLTDVKSATPREAADQAPSLERLLNETVGKACA